MASNNNVYNGQRTLLNASHFKRADKDNGTGQILWARDIDWSDITSTLGTLNSLFIIQKLEELSSSIVSLTSRVTALENQTPTPQLTLSATSGSIQRPKGSLSSISAVGGSDNITITVGSTANITAPTSLTLTYGANTNKTASTPTATYNGASVTPTWTSSDTSVATVSGTTITAKAAGSTTLTASYDGKTATYNLTVTNESTSGSVTSGWTYTSDSTNIATISGITVTGVTEGRTHITVNYGGKTCVLAGTVTVSAAPQLTLSTTSGSIQRPKGSLSSISAVGGSDNITITVGTTANITAPTSLTLTYGTNTNKTANTPTATYNGASVTPTWTSSDTSVATVSGTTITAKAAGSATLTASYDGKTATYNLTVANESTSGSVNSGWTYTSASTSIATISGTTVTGVAQGTTNIKVNYSGKTCDLTGTVTVNAATIYYWYAGQTNPSTMTSISPVVTSYENGGGWYELGTTLPTSIDQLIKGGTAGNIWYTAVPADSHLVPGSSADPDTSVNTGPTKVFSGVTYQIYIYEGVTGTRGSFELNT